MEFAMGHDLVELFHALRLHIDHIVNLGTILDMPQVHTEVVCRQKVFSIWREAQRVDMILVGASVLLLAPALPALVDYLGARHHYFALGQQLFCGFILLLFPKVDPP